MSAACTPISRAIAEEMLQVMARALCDRPGETAAQRDSRTQQMVHSVLGAMPRDGWEMMFASLIVGHFNLLLDSMADVLKGQAEAAKARTKATIVGLDRALIAYVRELRLGQQRPLEKASLPAKAAPVETVVLVDAPAAAAPTAKPAVSHAPAAGREQAQARGPEQATATAQHRQSAGSAVPAKPVADGPDAGAPPALHDAESLQNTMRVLAELIKGDPARGDPRKAPPEG